MKVYGAEICIDCRNYKAIQKKRGFEAEFIEITKDTGKLKEFLELRDHDPVFEPVREHGGIGIPLFVNDNLCSHSASNSLHLASALRLL